MSDERRTPVPPPPESERNTLDSVETMTLPSIPPSGIDAPTARLVVLRGAHPGQRFPLEAQSTLGRETGSTVPVDEPGASRRHALLERREDGHWEITDLDSRNGTLINGRPTRRAMLRFGDHIQIGSTVYLFSHVDPLEERILHREKLEAIGRLGAGIAHDINNILTGILMNAEYLSELDAKRPLSDVDVVESLRDLRNAATLGAELTRRILALARRGSGEHHQIDLSSLAHEAVSLARRTFGRGIVIEADVAPQIHVRGDRTHLHQLLMNLLLNARDAMPQGGTITITLGYAMPSEIERGEVAVAGRHAAIVVNDTGVGMDAATRERVFEPFFTTKLGDRGSGLGLSTVLDVMTAHGGTITCESVMGVGTTFRAVLPALVAAGRAETRTPLAIMRQPAVSAPATVLVVDDEPLARRSVARLIAREGHHVLSAADGREALAFLIEGGPPIDVVVMDLDMPEMDGQTAQREMAVRRPGLPVLILTGFVEESRQAQLIEDGVYAVLAKPCGAATLRAAITSALRAPRP